MIWVPPGGAAAASQQTIAGKASMGLLRQNTAKRTGKRRAKRAKASGTKKRRAKRSGGGKLKFGSPAWRKKYMKARKRK